jgi:hypothetical protein
MEGILGKDVRHRDTQFHRASKAVDEANVRGNKGRMIPIGADVVNVVSTIRPLPSARSVSAPATERSDLSRMKAEPRIAIKLGDAPGFYPDNLTLGRCVK